jgi:hypothetical protein
MEAAVDVLEVAWVADGRRRLSLDHRPGRCARCGRADEVVALPAVVSKVFTAYDGWADPTTGAICPCCAWGYRHPPLRAGAHLVTRSGHLRALTAAQVGQHLQRPLDPAEAFVVPLHPGRKHLMPTAVWGRITVEDAHLSWSAADVVRLEAVRRLRGRGFGSRMLTGPAPAFAALRRLTADVYGQVMQDWATVAPWRERRPWLDLALHITLSDSPAATAAAGPHPAIRKARP